MALKAINLTKRVNSLKFKQRHKQLKEMLLTAYGSFEEMALCGVEGWGRDAYSILLNHELFSRMVLSADDDGIEALQLYLDKGLLSHKPVCRALTAEEMAKFTKVSN